MRDCAYNITIHDDEDETGEVFVFERREYYP